MEAPNDILDLKWSTKNKGGMPGHKWRHPFVSRDLSTILKL